MRLLPALALLLAASAAAQPDPVDLDWTWTPEPVWIAQGAYASEAVEIGLGFSNRVFRSTERPESIPPLRIVFDAGIETTVRVFDRVAGLQDVGPGRFRGAVYDVSDPDAPRRLNLALVEDSRRETFDRDWAPTQARSTSQDLLLVLASDYDGGVGYAGRTAFLLDVLYEFSPSEAPGRGLYSTTAELLATPAPLRDVSAIGTIGGAASVRWTVADHAEAAEVRVRLRGLTVARAAARSRGVLVTGLEPDVPHALTVDLVDADGVVVASRPALARPAASEGLTAASVLDPAVTRRYGDTWGYTAPDGTEYALLTVWREGLYVLDLTGAPASAPTVVGVVRSPEGAGQAKDVKVFGHHAYLAHEYGPVSIIDLTDPTAPTEVGRLDTQLDTPDGGAHNVHVAEGHLWAVGGRTSGNAGLRVYSLADPTAPAFVGSFRPDHQTVPYYHDVEVRGGRAYGAAIYSGGGVDVLDVSDPAAIRLVTTFTYPGAGAHNTCTSEDGQTVYVGDEIGESGNWLRVFDVSDLGNVEWVGEVIVDEQAVVHNCVVRGDRLYVAHYTEGLRVYDISVPHEPAEVAFLDIVPEPVYGLDGAWTAYPFPGSGKVIVSDYTKGLWVAELGADAPAPQPSGEAALTLSPNPTTGGVRVGYTLDEDARVRIALVDVLGREVAVVYDRADRAGPHRPVVDVGRLPSGRYIAVLTADGERLATAPVTIVR